MQHSNQTFQLFLKELLKTIISQRKYYLLPYALLQTTVKLFGYKIGCLSLNTPKWFNKLCSEQTYYWTSKYYDNKEVKLWK
jgi:rhamnosyltransferase